MMLLQDRLSLPVKSRRAVPQAPFKAAGKLLGMDPEMPYELLSYPIYVSDKLNGVRGVAVDKKWYSPACKEVHMHPVVKEYFSDILEWADKNKVVLDGEFHAYSHNSVGETISILAGTKPIPADFYFKCFYCIPWDIWNGFEREVDATVWSFMEGNSIELMSPRLKLVTQRKLNNLDEVLAEIDKVRYTNKEGLVFLDPRAYYKHGKATPNEATLIKWKRYSDPIDAKICNLTRRQERVEGVESKINPHTGKAEQVHTQDSFYETDMAGVMICQCEDGEIVEVPFPVGTTFEDRRIYLKEFNTGSPADLKGRWLCFRKLACEDRGKPVSIKDVQFRDDKD